MADTFQGRPASYLGDGLYAVDRGCDIELRATDLHFPTDLVYLEPQVLAALIRFAGAEQSGGTE